MDASKKVLSDAEGGRMVECLVMGPIPQAERVQIRVEGADVNWSCVVAGTRRMALSIIRHRLPDALMVCSPEDAPLLDTLGAEPPLRAFWVLTGGWAHPLSDLMLTEEQAQELPARLRELGAQCVLPHLSRAYQPELRELTLQLLRALGMPGRLSAWSFLPEMAALCAIYPPLLNHVGAWLYPLIGERYQLRPGTVERQLRLAVESTWNRGRVDVLDRLFGQTIDPERGKPTNKEFLCRVAEWLVLTQRRALLQQLKQRNAQHGGQRPHADCRDAQQNGLQPASFHASSSSVS